MQEPIHNAIFNPLQLGTEYLGIPFQLRYLIILIFTYFLHLIDLIFQLKRPFDQKLVFLYQVIALLPKFRNFFVKILKGRGMCGGRLGQWMIDLEELQFAVLEFQLSVKVLQLGLVVLLLGLELGFLCW